MSEEFNPFGPVDLKRRPRAYCRLDSQDEETRARLRENKAPPVPETYRTSPPEDALYANALRLEVIRISVPEQYRENASANNDDEDS